MDKRRSRFKFVSYFMSLPILLTLVACAQAATAEDFYRGKTVTISVGFGTGGGYDAYARLIARHMGKYMPGNPTFVVENAPGAAGLVLANSLYNVLPKDGTQLGTFDRSIPLDPLFDGSKAHFDPLKFGWIGSPSNEISTCVAWRTSPVKSFDDLKRMTLMISGTGPAADVVDYPLVMNAFAGTKFRVIMGYPGSSEALLAMQRGETQGFCAWGWSSIEATHGDWLRNKDIIPLVQFGMHKQKGHENVPLARDLVATDEGRAAVDLITAPQVFARPFAAPPGVPDERLAALRAAFESTIRDPDFLKEAAKQNLEIELVTGLQIESALKRVYATPASVVKLVRAALQ